MLFRFGVEELAPRIWMGYIMQRWRPCRRIGIFDQYEDAALARRAFEAVELASTPWPAAAPPIFVAECAGGARGKP